MHQGKEDHDILAISAAWARLLHDAYLDRHGKVGAAGRHTILYAGSASISDEDFDRDVLLCPIFSACLAARLCSFPPVESFCLTSSRALTTLRRRSSGLMACRCSAISPRSRTSRRLPM